MYRQAGYPTSSRPVVAYCNVSLHEDGEFSVSASAEHLQDCKSVDTAQLKRRLLEVHQSQLHALQGSIRQTRARHFIDDPHVLDRRAWDESRMKHQSTRAVSVSSSSDASEAEAKPMRQAYSFRINDDVQVKNFLTARLRHMQQNAVKRIAKAWIKGICPKKQAKFPYHAHSTVPGWWPNVKDCPFKEPDHIKKNQRLVLCLHLLTLRPKAGQLQSWNEDPRMPHASNNLDEWTKFLKNVAPVDIVKDSREPEEINDCRMKFLAELYQVAQMQEDYLEGAKDGTTQYHWSEDPQEKTEELRRKIALERRTRTRASKKRRRSSLSPVDLSRRSSEDTTVPTKKLKKEKLNTNKSEQSLSDPVPDIDDVERSGAQESTAMSAVVSQDSTSLMLDRPVLRQQHVSTQRVRKQLPVNTRTKPTTKFNNSTTTNLKEGQSTSTTEASTTYPNHTRHHDRMYDPWHTPLGNYSHSYTTGQGMQDDALTTSFSSTGTSFYQPSMTDSFMISSSMIPPALQAMSFDQAHRVHMVTHLPQPHLETVPNSPIMPHASLLGMQLDQNALVSYSQPHPWTTPTQPSNAFMSTSYSPFISMSQPSSGFIIKDDEPYPPRYNNDRTHAGHANPYEYQ